MPSELDAYLGPRAEPTPPAAVPLTRDELLVRALQSTNRWQCAERIRPALNAFFDCWPDLLPRSADVRRTHYRAAETLVDEVGEDAAPAFIRWANEHISTSPRPIAVKTCRSLLWLVGDWRERIRSLQSIVAMREAVNSEPDDDPPACPRCGKPTFHPDMPCTAH